MPRTTQELEKRLARVEKELAELKATLAHQHTHRWYRDIVGDFAEDDAFPKIVRFGRLIRKGKLQG